MTLRSLTGLFVAVLWIGLLPECYPAEPIFELPFLHPLFSDNAVLQRDVPVPVWGWATPGEAVSVTLGGKTAIAIAGQDGRWQVKLGPFPAGGPLAMKVSGSQMVEASHILVGDVWICTGGSNMDWPVASANNSDLEISQANYPQIRLLNLPKFPCIRELKTPGPVTWQICTPSSIGLFSAVSYFFGREMHDALKVPIGLIEASSGSTVTEAWASGHALRALEAVRPEIESLEKRLAGIRDGSHALLVNEWFRSIDPGSAQDWQNPATDTAAWKTGSLPNSFENLGLPGFSGIVWLIHAFEIPPDWSGREAVINLGPIDEFDTTWINGTLVGSLDIVNVPRIYRVPANVLQAGRNVMAIRVVDTWPTGGLVGNAQELKLYPPGQEQLAVSLAGQWCFQETLSYAQFFPLPDTLFSHSWCHGHMSTLHYNAMIAPLIPFAIKGVISYQEGNQYHPERYREVLPTLIRDWRARFGQGNLAFHLVSLPNYGEISPLPAEDQWAGFREIQSLVAVSTPNCGLATTIDIGEKDLHPRNKQDVGHRLALSALANTHGHPLEWSGPWFHTMEKTSHAIRLYFDHAGNGLVAKGVMPTGFAIAGSDCQFVWARAQIEGDTVLVWAPEIPEPQFVRYAWGGNPVCNLYNRQGLPAVPFRTDARPLGSQNERVVLSANPLAYWPLNETGGASLSGGLAYDYWGGKSGHYRRNARLGSEGPRPPGFRAFAPSNLALRVSPQATESWAEMPPLNTNANSLTIIAWIKPSTFQNCCGLVTCRTAGKVAGLGLSGGGSPDAGCLTYVWNGVMESESWNSGLRPPTDAWSLAAMVVQPSQAVLHLVNSTGQFSATHYVEHESLAFDGPVLLGSEGDTAQSFDGFLDEVAIFSRAMSLEEIRNFYDGIYPATELKITLRHTDAGWWLQWPEGLLESKADWMSGWLVVPGAASPFKVETGEVRRFYRIRNQGGAHVTNACP